jgi:hypothetical protein
MPIVYSWNILLTLIVFGALVVLSRHHHVVCCRRRAKMYVMRATRLFGITYGRTELSNLVYYDVVFCAVAFFRFRFLVYLRRISIKTWY